MKRHTIEVLFLIGVLGFALGYARAEPVQVIHANDSLANPPPRAPISEWTSSPQRRTISLAVGNAVLRGWLYPASQKDAPTLLVFGGNGYAVASADAILRGLAMQGANVVEYDYRGYGFSSGQADIFHMRSDALRLFDATTERLRGLPPVVLGYSLGSIFAAYVASQRSVRGLILVSPLESTQAEVAYLLQPGTYELAPDSIEAQNVARFVAESRAPLLVTHGTLDRLIPMKEGRAVYLASGSTNKSFVAVKAAHRGMLANPQVLAAVKHFLAKIVVAP
jgi:uncharacterized protein